MQIGEAGTRLLDYGVLGIALIFVGFFCWYLINAREKDAKEWKEQGKEMSKNFVQLVTKQNETNQRLIDIREKDSNENREFHEDISRKVDDLPNRLLKEMEYRTLQKSQSNAHTTPAP